MLQFHFRIAASNSESFYNKNFPQMLGCSLQVDAFV